MQRERGWEERIEVERWPRMEGKRAKREGGGGGEGDRR